MHSWKLMQWHRKNLGIGGVGWLMIGVHGDHPQGVSLVVHLALSVMAIRTIRTVSTWCCAQARNVTVCRPACVVSSF